MSGLLPLVLLADGALFFVAFALGITHARRSADQGQAATLGRPAYAIVAAGTAIALALLVFRAIREGTISLPLSDHLDAFALLAVLLAAVAAYFRATRRFRPLALFMFPMIGALLVLGGVLSSIAPGAYNYSNVWALLHVVTVIAGTLCLALGCVGGGVYLLAHRQLKPPGMAAAAPVRGLPPLAAIDRFNQVMVYAGFPLLTLAMITGFLRFAQEAGAGTAAGGWHVSTKILLAAAAWVVYAVVAHAPLNPRVRGLHAAWLSILGFSLFLATYAAVTWM